MQLAAFGDKRGNPKGEHWGPFRLSQAKATLAWAQVCGLCVCAWIIVQSLTPISPPLQPVLEFNEWEIYDEDDSWSKYWEQLDMFTRSVESEVLIAALRTECCGVHMHVAA